MRTNQVSIKIERFHKQVPDSYPVPGYQRISVYSDSSDSLWEALSMAYAQAVNTVREWEPIAVRTDIVTNATPRRAENPVINTMSGRMLGRRYDDDCRIDYLENRLQMYRSLLYIIEHSDEITAIIKSAEDEADARRLLMEKLGFSLSLANSALLVRFQCFTKKEIREIEEDIAEMERIRAKNQAAESET